MGLISTISGWVTGDQRKDAKKSQAAGKPTFWLDGQLAPSATSGNALDDWQRQAEIFGKYRNQEADAKARVDVGLKRQNIDMQRKERELSVAGSDWEAAQQRTQGAYDGIQSSADRAIAMRNQALAANDLNAAADRGIQQNNALAQQRLALAIGQQNRAAQALASGQGEGGALAMQAAIAQAGQANADQALQSDLAQAQLANDMRYKAAQDQVTNALGVSRDNATTTVQTNQFQNALAAAQQGLADQRQARIREDLNKTQLANLGLDISRQQAATDQLNFMNSMLYQNNAARQMAGQKYINNVVNQQPGSADYAAKYGDDVLSFIGKMMGGMGGGGAGGGMGGFGG